MGCENCGSTVTGGPPRGCKSNGSCMTGGCNRLNTYDWLINMPIPEDQRYDMVEVSFKNGSRKEFIKNEDRLDVLTGDMVAVETDSGFDIGRISLSGELVKTQIKKKNWVAKKEVKVRKIIRKARTEDLAKLVELRAKEGATMLKARKFAMALKLDMKIGDVEYQADNRKATFYYTAENRVDFRELIKQFAQEFKVKIEMRQIGARQEAGKIGGIGSCGRELCCSTWLTEFKSVSTAAARYQNLAINQTKLSGQCGRLKCCLNFELDTYTEALKEFPKGAKLLRTKDGLAGLQKTNVFKRLMYYSYVDSAHAYALTSEQVREILEINKRDELADGLSGITTFEETEEVEVAFVEDGKVSLKNLEKGSRNRRNKSRKSDKNRPANKNSTSAKDKRSNSSSGKNDQRSDSTTSRNNSRTDNKQPTARSGSSTKDNKKHGIQQDPKKQVQKKPLSKGGANRPPKPNRNKADGNEKRDKKLDHKLDNKSDFKAQSNEQGQKTRGSRNAKRRSEDSDRRPTSQENKPKDKSKPQSNKPKSSNFKDRKPKTGQDRNSGGKSSNSDKSNKRAQDLRKSDDLRKSEDSRGPKSSKEDKSTREDKRSKGLHKPKGENEKGKGDEPKS